MTDVERFCQYYNTHPVAVAGLVASLKHGRPAFDAAFHAMWARANPKRRPRGAEIMRRAALQNNLAHGFRGRQIGQPRG